MEPTDICSECGRRRKWNQFAGYEKVWGQGKPHQRRWVAFSPLRCKTCPRGSGRRQQDQSLNGSVVYQLRHTATGLIKIGRTDHWEQRRKQLEVGISTELIRLSSCWNTDDAAQVERSAHRLLAAWRLPQSEWFHVNADAADAAVAYGVARLAVADGRRKLAELPADEAQPFRRELLESLRAIRLRVTTLAMG